MLARALHFLAIAVALVLLDGTVASAQTNPCELLTTAEAAKHVARGRPTYGQGPEQVTVAGGTLCEYADGQVGIWSAPKASENLERFLKIWKVDKATRHRVAGVGEGAWIMYPVPEDKYKDRVAYLVAHVGDRILTVSLAAHDGQADSWMGEICTWTPERLKPDERKDCVKVLADKSETQESLGPNVIELAKLLVAKVRK